VSVVIAIAGLGVTILWPDQKFLGWGLLWIAAIIFFAWTLFEVVQWVGWTWKAVLLSLGAATLIFGALSVLQWETRRNSNDSESSQSARTQVTTTPHQDALPVDRGPKPEAPPKRPKVHVMPPVASALSKSVEARPTDKPEVVLSLVHTASPAVSLHNVSNAVANNIKWGIILWNTTHPDPSFTPLQIPIQMFDWIKPGQYGGPEDVFSRVSSQLQPGDRLVGCAFVDCPDCIKGHSYLVEIVWGQGGWYSEWASGNGNPVYPINWSVEGKEGYFAQIEATPLAYRVAITPQ
jgi:ABC-type multidrug transport system fused ATPase/permease subunit